MWTTQRFGVRRLHDKPLRGSDERLAVARKPRLRLTIASDRRTSSRRTIGMATEERSAEGVGILHATRPAPVGSGDELEIAIGTARRTVIVRGAAARRVSAAEAVILCEETEESAAERRRGAELRRLAGPVDFGGRLTQRDRRRCEAGRQ